MSVIYNRIDDFFSDPTDNGYDSNGNTVRFNILSGITFSSLLDVGSGPCYLKTWLAENEINCSYEAVDVREDSLLLCNCTHYTEIPLNKQYDVVCLFETVGFNIDFDVTKNKNILNDLLTKSKQVAQKYVVFSVFNESKKQEISFTNKDEIVWFTEQELETILTSIGYTNYSIFERNDLHEYLYYVICDVS